MAKKLYPIFLDLSMSRCLIVGAGRVGYRKAAGLLKGGANDILVLDTSTTASSQNANLSEKHCFSSFLENDSENNLKINALKKVQNSEKNLPTQWDSLIKRAEGKITLEQRVFVSEDVQNCALVFAATSDHKTNAAVIAACRQFQIPCNSAENPDAGNFYVPARIDSGSITVAVSTGGSSPALAASIHKDLEKWLAGRYENLCLILEYLRPLVLQLGKNSEENGELFRSLVHSPLAIYLQKQDYAACQKLLQTLLPESLHEHIEKILQNVSQ